MQLVVPTFIAIAVVAIARMVSIYLPIGIINATKTEEHIPKSWQMLLSWGSLRGALALMMVLLIPGEGQLNYEAIIAFQQSVGWNYDFDIKEFLLILTIGSIMFTLFIKAPTISVLMKYLKVDKLHQLEEFEYVEGKILSNLKVLEKLNTSYKKAYLTKIEYEDLADKYSVKLKEAVDSMQGILSDKDQNVDDLIRRAISLHALGIEKQYLKELLFYNELDEKNFKYILRKIEKQMERIENEDIQLRSISGDGCDYDIFSKLAIKLYKNHTSKLDTYIRNRSRVIITRKVIKELRSLAEIDF
jgi:CPA1 family monovalent cation:H+ antiporter